MILQGRVFMNDFDKAVRQNLGKNLEAAEVQTIQVNLGLRCNLSCRHCHVEASPERQEVMSSQTMDSVLRLARALPGVLIDITGGAPELNPEFNWFIEILRKLGHPVQVRSNLTVFFEPGMDYLPEFYRRHQVQLVASLPCYLDENVCAQRGAGVHKKSVEAIRQLNALGYASRPELPLSLVYNPGGPFLPPGQSALEADYRRHLQEHYGIGFTRLLTIANMPIGRFLDELKSQDKEVSYRDLLEESFNPATVDGLMCRHQICVAWDGRLADCVVTGKHCFGCTAGCGSSCGGALVA